MSSEAVLPSTPSAAELAVLDAAEFCKSCARFATGIAVVTTLDGDGQPHGMTVNSFTSVSLDPLLFLVSLDRKAGILPLVSEGSLIGLNILAQEQRALSARFARPGEDRFGAVEWFPGRTGAPFLPGALAHLEGRVVQIVPAGDHLLVITEVIGGSYREGRPLVYFGSRYHTLGEQFL